MQCLQSLLHGSLHACSGCRRRLTVCRRGSARANHQAACGFDGWAVLFWLCCVVLCAWWCLPAWRLPCSQAGVRRAGSWSAVPQLPVWCLLLDLRRMWSLVLSWEQAAMAGAWLTLLATAESIVGLVSANMFLKHASKAWNKPIDPAE